MERLAAQLSRPPRPIMKHGTLCKDRRFGRYDFQRFDLSSSPVSLGHETFDKVVIDCQFLFTKSKWGVIGEFKNPAGILYIDLSFQQPKGSQLSSATVIVTLDDEDRELYSMHKKSRPPVPRIAHITDWYGPRDFVGPGISKDKKSKVDFNPNFGAGGFNASGLELNRESSYTQSSSWKITGQLLPGKSGNGAYKSLKWELSENDLEAQSKHAHDIHTAFAFEHDGDPLYVRVEIKGKLKNVLRNAKDKLLKFPSSKKKDDASTVTLIDFGGRGIFLTPLDEQARNLRIDMAKANADDVPDELPNSKPVAYESTTSDPANNLNGSAVSDPLQDAVTSSANPQQVQNSTQPQASDEAKVDPTTVTLANLARPLSNLSASAQQSTQNDGSNAKPTATTLVDEVDKTEDRNLSAQVAQQRLQNLFIKTVLHLAKISVLLFLQLNILWRALLVWSPLSSIRSLEGRRVHHGHRVHLDRKPISRKDFRTRRQYERAKMRELESSSESYTSSQSKSCSRKLAETVIEDRRSRSRRRKSSVSVVSDDELARSTSKHRDPEHRNRRVAQAGLATAAVAGLVERARSKSRSRKGKSRSRSQIRQGVPIAAAGLAGAAITGLYKRRQARKEEKEERSRPKSRSRSVPSGRRHSTSSDTALVEYGGEPIYTDPVASTYRRRPSDFNNPADYRSGRRGLSKSLEGRHRRRSRSSRSRSKSRSRKVAKTAAVAGVAGLATHEATKRRERKKAEKERQRHADKANFSNDSFLLPPPPGRYFPETNYFPPPGRYFPETNHFPPPPTGEHYTAYNPANYPLPGAIPPQHQEPYGYTPPDNNMV